MIDVIETIEHPVMVPERKKTKDPVKREVMLYKSAINYLYAKAGDSETVQYYLNLYKYRQLNDMKDLYFQLLEHAKNRQGTPYAVDDIKEYKDVLFDFDPAAVVHNYRVWEDVFDAIKTISRAMSEPDKSSKKSYWVLYTKTIFSAARFLSRFSSIWDFKEYVQSFVQGHKDKRIALALLLSQEIDGIGFIMACDFLKEWVSPFFVKPDIHTKEIFSKTHFCSKSDTDYDICRKMIDFSDAVGETPYVVDRVFWLIGNGRLFRTEERKREVKIATSKTEFIAGYLNESNYH